MLKLQKGTPHCSTAQRGEGNRTEGKLSAGEEMMRLFSVVLESHFKLVSRRCLTPWCCSQAFTRNFPQIQSSNVFL